MKLLQDYEDGDELAVNMFDNMDWYIVPSLNVDGYTYTWTNVGLSFRRVWLPLKTNPVVFITWFRLHSIINMPLLTRSISSNRCVFHLELRTEH